MQSHSETCNLKSLMKQQTCYTNLNISTHIYLILKNVPSSFQSSCATQIELWDFHLMNLTVIRIYLKKIWARIVIDRCFKQVNNKVFREFLRNNPFSEEFFHNDKWLQWFCKVCIKTVNSFVPIKRKFTQENQTSFMRKKLSKEIMVRSRSRFISIFKKWNYRK